MFTIEINNPDGKEYVESDTVSIVKPHHDMYKEALSYAMAENVNTPHFVKLCIIGEEGNIDAITVRDNADGEPFAAVITGYGDSGISILECRFLYTGDSAIVKNSSGVTIDTVEKTTMH